MIAMGLFPPSAVVVAPLLAVYNSVGVVDRMNTQAARGTLTLGMAASSVGEIALNPREDQIHDAWRRRCGRIRGSNQRPQLQATKHLPGRCMDSLVPSFLSIGGVVFPLIATDHVVWIGKNTDGPDLLEGLSAAVDHMVGGDARDVSLAQLARDGFRVQGLRA